MPYYRCTSCALLSYSAANHSTVGRCPYCEVPLPGAKEEETPVASAPRDLEPLARVALPEASA